ncbi:MAG TPA: hypothetical protein VFJ43_12650, partial [Bacteroidia bacterium]|nr:hypothetical protein [Bacteroidia bacterium]
HLDNFIKEAARLLRHGGILMTTRDHVIYDAKDKSWFLDSHPLHKYYGGENAFTETEYVAAIKNARLEIVKTFHHYDSVINFFPEKKSAIDQQIADRQQYIENFRIKKTPAFLRNNNFLKDLYFKRANRKLGPVLDERKIPGRHISFIAVKP